jgi:hypothetical protein
MKIRCYNEMNTQPTGLISQSTTHQHHIYFSSSISSNQIHAAMGCHRQSHFFSCKKKFHSLLRMCFSAYTWEVLTQQKTSYITYDDDNTLAHLCREGNKTLSLHLNQYILHTAEPSHDNCLWTHLLYSEKNHKWGLCQNQTENEYCKLVFSIHFVFILWDTKTILGF